MNPLHIYFSGNTGRFADAWTARMSAVCLSIEQEADVAPWFGGAKTVRRTHMT